MRIHVPGGVRTITTESVGVFGSRVAIRPSRRLTTKVTPWVTQDCTFIYRTMYITERLSSPSSSHQLLPIPDLISSPSAPLPRPRSRPTATRHARWACTNWQCAPTVGSKKVSHYRIINKFYRKPASEIDFFRQIKVSIKNNNVVYHLVLNILW